MGVRAKFVVNTITRAMQSVYKDGKSSLQEVQSVKLFVVSAGPSDEDKDFWMSTPTGSIELNIVNPAAVALFADNLGRNVYVDFTPADD
jgi:hypothetical protein